ncbi:uncharacterized protein LODBEIA_P17730 [Lodderomyces beijingensis]|uniref:non-specific serine/threonine protein kinase n=1 Tax=Lodderomyces beijingensis TaxID=1775926 RepID=A0ABP0ZI48_9ASCO
MGDSSKAGTLSKLGKLFGKSSTNLATIKQQPHQDEPQPGKSKSPDLPPPAAPAAPSSSTSTSSSSTSTSSSASSSQPQPHPKRDRSQSKSTVATVKTNVSTIPEDANTHDEDYLLSQVENDEVTPLRQIKQPQPQSVNTAASYQSLNNAAAATPQASANSSPKLTTTRSPSPVNNISNNHTNNVSTTTSPMSVNSLDQRKQTLASGTTFVPANGSRHASVEKIPQLPTTAPAPTSVPQPTSNRTSPSVSRSSSRKVVQQLKATSSNSIASAKQKNESAASLVSGTSSQPVSSTTTATTAMLPRFVMLEDGSHEHHLKSAKRHEKLSNMLKDLLGAKKLRDEAKSAVPDILQGAMQQSTSQLHQQQQQQQQQQSSQLPDASHPPTLFSGLVSQVKNHTSPYHQPGTADIVTNHKDPNAPTGPDCRSFVEKYGRCQEVIGRGSFGVVRISHKKIDAPATTSSSTSSPTESSPTVTSNGTSEKLYAVKEFKRKPSENEKKYNRRLTSEFCISSSLKHLNIIDTLDLLKDAKGDYCEVMEFCSGGDLYTLIIASGKLEYAEADCFFKQLIRGVNYMHNMGVAHRDLKPENLLLTQNGVLKITDFGNSECFKMAWENEIQFSEGVCGSSPYIAPEEYNQETFDPRCVDIWSCGVIYMAMRTGRQLWKLADATKDEFFEEYLAKRKDASGYEPIENLKRARCRNVIYSILDPKPERRITSKQILNSEWGREIKVCEAGEGHLASCC